MARAGLRRGHEESGERPNISLESFCRNACIKRGKGWCQESVHEESHGLGPAPIMCRRPVASIKASRRIPAFQYNGYSAEAVVCHLDGAFARIWTLNERENMLELQASAGLYTRLDGEHARVPVGNLKIGRIAQERKPCWPCAEKQRSISLRAPGPAMTKSRRLHKPAYSVEFWTRAWRCCEAICAMASAVRAKPNRPVLSVTS
jgi:hypothetical protein